MRIKKKLIVGLVLGSFLIVGTAYAKPRGGGGGLLNPERIERIASRLGVDDATMKKMRTLLYGAKRKRVTLRGQIEQARIDLHELMQQEQTDRSAIMKKVDSIGGLQIQARKLKLGTMLDLRALLNPEQQKKLRTMMQKRRSRRAGKRRKRGHRNFDRSGGPHGEP